MLPLTHSTIQDMQALQEMNVLTCVAVKNTFYDDFVDNIPMPPILEKSKTWDCGYNGTEVMDVMANLSPEDKAFADAELASMVEDAILPISPKEHIVDRTDHLNFPSTPTPYASSMMTANAVDPFKLQVPWSMNVPSVNEQALAEDISSSVPVQAQSAPSRSKRSDKAPEVCDTQALKLIDEVTQAAEMGRHGVALEYAKRDKQSSATVQRAIEMISHGMHQGCHSQQENLAPNAALYFISDFQGYVYEAATHRHANFVIHAIIEHMPASFSSFIAQELVMKAVQTAKHKLGCRTVIRIIRHLFSSNSNEAVLELVQQIADQASELCCHEFGNYVIQELIEHGGNDHHDRIAEGLRNTSDGLVGAAANKHGGAVMEKVIERYPAQVGYGLVSELLSSMEATYFLASNEFGCAVLKKAIARNYCSQQVVHQVLSAIRQQGKRLKIQQQLLDEFRRY